MMGPPWRARDDGTAGASSPGSLIAPRGGRRGLCRGDRPRVAGRDEGGAAVPSRASLARARVGWGFSQPVPQASPGAWAALAADVATVRESWPASLRKVLDLTCAVRGIRPDGKPDWALAEQLCRQLSWPRCARPALEAMGVRGRPCR